MRLSCRWPRRLCPAKVPGPSNRVGVVRVGVGDVDLAVHGVDGHRVQDGADALEEAGRARELARRVGHGVEHEHVLVGQRELHVLSRGRPSASTQWAPFHLTMAPTSGAGGPSELVAGPGTPSGPKPSGSAVSATMVVRLPVWKPAA